VGYHQGCSRSLSRRSDSVRRRIPNPTPAFDPRDVALGGSTDPHPTPGTNDTRTLFGALNIRTGQWTYLVRQRMRKEDFVAFLEHLLVAYPCGPIILIVDNYSSHTAHLIRNWLDLYPRLQLYYLPKYCSHLNSVEGIWLQLKNKIAANRLYGSMKILIETVDVFFDEMTPTRALAWAAA
jgi:transposase